MRQALCQHRGQPASYLRVIAGAHKAVKPHVPARMGPQPVVKLFLDERHIGEFVKVLKTLLLSRIKSNKASVPARHPFELKLQLVQPSAFRIMRVGPAGMAGNRSHDQVLRRQAEVD